MVPLINTDALENLHIWCFQCLRGDNYRLYFSLFGEEEIWVTPENFSFFSFEKKWNPSWKEEDEAEISNIRLETIHPSFIQDLLLDLDPMNSFSTLEIFLIERFLRFAITSDMFVTSTFPDWYGDVGLEVQFVLTPKFREQAKEFNSLPTVTEKIWWILNLEYKGFIPKDILEFPFWELQELDFSSISSSPTKNNENSVSEYQSSLPYVLGLVVKGYLRDGHHRFEAAKRQGRSKGLFLVPTSIPWETWQIACDFAMSLENNPSHEFKMLCFEEFMKEKPILK